MPKTLLWRLPGVGKKERTNTEIPAFGKKERKPGRGIKKTFRGSKKNFPRIKKNFPLRHTGLTSFGGRQNSALGIQWCESSLTSTFRKDEASTSTGIRIIGCPKRYSGVIQKSSCRMTGRLPGATSGANNGCGEIFECKHKASAPSRASRTQTFF